MSRRNQVQMSESEVKEFLQERHTMTLATVGKDGTPHLVAMWYGFVGDDIAVWTYHKSQKARNLERDTRIVCLVESGDTYESLRGVELRGHAVLVRELDEVRAIGRSCAERYIGDSDDAQAGVEAQAPKRVGILIKVQHVASWDHRKLGGVY